MKRHKINFSMCRYDAFSNRHVDIPVNALMLIFKSSIKFHIHLLNLFKETAQGKKVDLNTNVENNTHQDKKKNPTKYNIKKPNIRRRRDIIFRKTLR